MRSNALSKKRVELNLIDDDFVDNADDVNGNDGDDDDDDGFDDHGGNVLLRCSSV